MVSTRIPSSASTGAAAMNGSEMTTALASIILMTAVVSSAQRSRSVRGVGWCSMVRQAPRIQMPCAVGAISTGAPASTATASPCPTPAAASPPAIATGPLVHLAPGMADRASGSPVTMPLRLVWALAYIVSVNLLMTIPSASPPRRRVGSSAHKHEPRLIRHPGRSAAWSLSATPPTKHRVDALTVQTRPQPGSAARRYR